MKRQINLSKFTSFVLLLTVTAMILVAGTYAKYSSNASGTDSAIVANWSFKVNGTDIAVLGDNDEVTFGLFDTIYDSDGKTTESNVTPGLIAPGTSGSFKFSLENSSEVTTEYSIKLSVDNTMIPLEFSLDNENWTPITNLSNLVATDIIGIGLSKNVTVQWKWAFDGDTDSSLGGQQVNVTANITATQVDNGDVVAVNKWENKTAVFVGDSITYGTGATDTSKTYWGILENSLGLSNVTGMGVNSSTISSQSDYGTTKEPLINRYITIPEADLISIFMGTNDYGHETPLGTINDTTDVSFYGALNVIIPNLQKALPNSRIVLITPIHRYGRGTSGILGTNYTYDNLPNGVGANLEDYVNAIKEIGAKYDVPVIDLYTLFDLDPSDENIRNEYMPDGLHPNDAGHQIMAELIAKELEKIAPMRVSDDNNSSDINNVKVEYGNDYGSANLNSLKRASVSKNVYLEAGTVISLVNPEEFKYSLYSQSSENITYTTNITGGYITNDYTITTSGWYGFALAHNDDSNFDLGGTDSNLLVGYINFSEPPAEPETDLNVTLQVGNDYGATTGDTPTRATVTKNIYLKAGTVISVKDASLYRYAVYNLPSEELAIATNISGGFITNDYTVSTSGWYGFVLAKDTNFDLGGTDPNVITDYLDFN